MYISKITVQLDTHRDLTFADFHSLCNAHTPGLKLDRDIVTNPLGKDGFYITGVNERASRAIATMALDYNIPVVRLDITFCAPIAPGVNDRAQYLEYHFQKERLIAHLARIKYNGNANEHTRFDTHYFQMGGDKSIKQLEIADHTDAPGEVEALQIVWRLRNVWAKEAWSWIQLDQHYQDGVDNAFCAATNFFLGPDFFHLGHNQNVFFQREAKPKEKPQADWRGYLDAAIKAWVKADCGPIETRVERVYKDFGDYLWPISL